METGTALPYQPIGDTGSTYVSGSNTITEAAEKLSIGKGQASKVDFHQGAGGNLIAVTNMSTGAIEATALEIEDPATGRQSWRQIDTSKFSTISGLIPRTTSHRIFFILLVFSTGFCEEIVF